MNPVAERTAALKAGHPTYVVEKPCQNGHTGPRRTKAGKCIACDEARQTRWRAARPGIEAEWARKRRARDPSGHRAEVKRWVQKNSVKKRKMDAEWRNANREHWRAYTTVYSQNRRAKKAANGGFYTVDDVVALHAKQRGCCAACGTDKRKLEVEHIVPVVRGGSNDPDNLQLLCRTCNASKGTKDMAEWMQSRRHHVSADSVTSN